MPINTDLPALYGDHIRISMQRMEHALGTCGKRGALIPSGSLKYTFLDDHTYPFKVNPHFKAWVPIDDVPESFLLIRPGQKPVLFYCQPVDYWHKPPADPTGSWTGEWDVRTISSASDIHNQIGDPRELAFIGEETELAAKLGIDSINARPLMNSLHFNRAFKTDYELGCLQLANINAARGHLAAETAFRNEESEFGIQMAYLAATRAREHEAPYGGIIALNENCAVLHYQHYETVKPKTINSMLIDAGYNYHGYAADITRTYAFAPGEFSHLVNRMDSEQLALIDEIETGMNYADVHERMHYRLARVLKNFDLVDMSPDAMVETNLTFTFLPHGLGHLLGLQTHDVGGFQQNEKGDSKDAPEKYPALRLTRPIENNEVFTIEPGLYFIPMLLQELRSGPHGKAVNWTRVESLLPYGGIRIEDNVAMINGSAVNLTRDAFVTAGSEA